MLFCSVIVAVLFGAVSPAAQSGANDPAVRDFKERIQHYLDLRKKLQESAPDRPLGDSIRLARRNAGEGEIFTPAAQKVFVATIKQSLSSARAGKTKQTVQAQGLGQEQEADSRVMLAVNGTYPRNAPQSTVPTFVVSRLPRVPQGVEYRFVGRHLILYDSRADVIVDILRYAIR